MAIIKPIQMMLVLLFFQLFIISWLNAQTESDYFQNYNYPVDQLTSELKSMKILEYSGHLLSIGNFLLIRPESVELPKQLTDFLSKKKVIRTVDEIGEESFKIVEFSYSDQFDSYLLLVESSDTENLAETKNLYLLNIKSDFILSVSKVAFYYKDVDGYHIQRYSIYEGNEMFQNIFEEISSHVEVVADIGEIKQNVIKTKFKIDMANGKTQVSIF